MSNVDDLQNAEEQVAQREEEALRQEHEAEHADLHQSPVKQTAAHGRQPMEVPLSKIQIAANMRTGELPEIQGLAISIREVGLISPLLVREEEDDAYRLVAGRRRLEALHRVHEDDKESLIRCEVITSDADESEAWVLMLTENLQRENPPPMQVARALRSALQLDPHLSASALARSLGKSPAWASRHLHLLDLPNSLQIRLEAGDLNFTIADLIRQGEKKGIIGEGDEDEIIDNVNKGAMSIEQLKRLVRPRGPGFVPTPPENYDEISRDLDIAKFGFKNRGNEPSEISAEQRDWEADEKPIKRTPRQSSSSVSQVDQPQQEYGARQLEAYLIGRLLREHASAQLLSQLGTTKAAAYNFAWNLANAEGRQHVMYEISVDLMDLDEELPAEIFTARHQKSQ
jgi:ParB/RepB/Spo0J family partition protein